MSKELKTLFAPKTMGHLIYPEIKIKSRKFWSRETWYRCLTPARMTSNRRTFFSEQLGQCAFTICSVKVNNYKRTRGKKKEMERKGIIPSQTKVKCKERKLTLISCLPSEFLFGSSLTVKPV